MSPTRGQPAWASVSPSIGRDIPDESADCTLPRSATVRLVSTLRARSSAGTRHPRSLSMVFWTACASWPQGGRGVATGLVAKFINSLQE